MQKKYLKNIFLSGNGRGILNAIAPEGLDSPQNTKQVARSSRRRRRSNPLGGMPIAPTRSEFMDRSAAPAKS
jgi:hypothetical protein